MKRILSLGLCVIIALLLFTSCSAADRPLTAKELLDLGETALLDFDYEQAIVYFDLLIKNDPANPRGYTGLAEAYVALGHTVRAATILLQGLASLPGNEEISAKLTELEADPNSVSAAPLPSFDPAAESTPEVAISPSPEYTPEPALVDDLSKYIGFYSTNHHEDRGENPEHSAGYGIEIHSISNGEITFDMDYIGRYWSPIYYTDLITAPLSGNMCEFQWADSWGNEGYGTLRLENENVIVRTVQTKTAEVNRASFDNGGEIVLSPIVNSEPTPSPTPSTTPMPTVSPTPIPTQPPASIIDTLWAKIKGVWLCDDPMIDENYFMQIGYNDIDNTPIVYSGWFRSEGGDVCFAIDAVSMGNSKYRITFYVPETIGSDMYEHKDEYTFNNTYDVSKIDNGILIVGDFVFNYSASTFEEALEKYDNARR